MEEKRKLLIAAQAGDRMARDRLVNENTGLIWNIVKRFLNRGQEAEDLFQVGCIGLMKAIDRFDLSLGLQFSTYAVPMITGEIQRFLRDDGLLRVSRSLKENAARLVKERERLEKLLNREPTLQELEEASGIERTEIVMAMEACTEVESIYQTIYQGDGNEILLMDRLEDQKNDNETLLQKIMVGELMNSLEQPSRKLIELRYFQEKTQSEVAKELGISQVQVSRLEKKILNGLRKLCS